jgi:hypothetical protein
VTESCEHGNELSVSIKGGEFLDQLNDCHCLKTDSAAWIALRLCVPFQGSYLGAGTGGVGGTIAIPGSCKSE